MALPRWSILICDPAEERLKLASQGAIAAGLRVVETPLSVGLAIVAASIDRPLPTIHHRATVLVYGGVDGRPLPIGVHARLPAPIDHAAFVQALRTHIPPSGAVLDRLAATFGHEEISRLVARMHHQLTEAVSCGSVLSRSQHHQLAGFAGMLGFETVHDASQRLSVGKDSAEPIFTAAARAAIKTIEAHSLFTPAAKTFV